MPIVPSFVGLCLLLLVGHVLRVKVRLLRRLYLPSCVIGGLAGLAVLQGAKSLGAPVPGEWTAGWGKLPGFLIASGVVAVWLSIAFVPRLLRGA